VGNHSKCFKCGELDEFCVCRSAPVSAQQGAAEQHNAVECDSALRAEPASQHDANLAALRLVRELSRISMSLAADLVQGASYTFQGHDYLDRDWAMRRVMDWRAEWDATTEAQTELATRCRAEGGDTSDNSISDLAAKAPAAQAVEPEGWQLVPKKLTDKMQGVLVFGRTQPTHNTYLNLLAVAPKYDAPTASPASTPETAPADDLLITQNGAKNRSGDQR
jgi:hypothetical protein